jgi:hypothetical protein
VETVKKRDVSAILADHARVEATLQRAVRAALLQHKQLGHSIHVWQDGRVVEIPPEKIPEYDDSE